MSRLLLLLLLLLGAARGADTSKTQAPVGAGVATLRGAGLPEPRLQREAMTLKAVEALQGAREPQRVSKPVRTLPSPTMDAGQQGTLATPFHSERVYTRTQKHVQGSPATPQADTESMLLEQSRTVTKALAPGLVRREATVSWPRAVPKIQAPSRESKMAAAPMQPPKKAAARQQSWGPPAARRSQGDSAKTGKGGCIPPLCTGSPSFPRNLSKDPASSTHRPVSMVTKSLRQDSDSPEQTHQSGSDGNVQHRPVDGFTEPGRSAWWLEVAAVANRRRTASDPRTLTQAETIKAKQPANTIPLPPEATASPPSFLSSEARLPHSSVTREFVQPVGMATGASKSKTFAKEKVAESEHTQRPKTTFTNVNPVLLRTELQPAKRCILATPGARLPTSGVSRRAAPLHSLLGMSLPGTRVPHPLPISHSPDASAPQTSTRKTLPPPSSVHPRASSLTSQLASNSLLNEGAQKELNIMTTLVTATGSSLTAIFQSPSPKPPPFRKPAIPEFILRREHGNPSVLEKRDARSLPMQEPGTADSHLAPELPTQAQQSPSGLSTTVNPSPVELTTPPDNSQPPKSTPRNPTLPEQTTLTIQSPTPANQKPLTLSTSRDNFLPELNTIANQIPPALTTLTIHSPVELTTSANRSAPEVTTQINQIPPELTMAKKQIPSELTTSENRSSLEPTTADSPLLTLITAAYHYIPELTMPGSQSPPDLSKQVKHSLTELTTQAEHYPPGRATPANQTKRDVTTPAAPSQPELTTLTIHSTELTRLGDYYIQDFRKPANQSTHELIPQVNQSPTELTTPANNYLMKLTTPKKHYLQELNMPADQALRELILPTFNSKLELSTSENKRPIEVTAPATNSLSELTMQEDQSPLELSMPTNQSPPELSTQAELSAQSAPASHSVLQVTRQAAHHLPELTTPENQTLPDPVTSLRLQQAKQTKLTNWLASDLTMTARNPPSEQTLISKHPLLEMTTFTSQSPWEQNITTRSYQPKRLAPEDHVPLKQTSIVDNFQAELTTPVSHFIANSDTPTGHFPPELAKSAGQSPQEQTTTAGQTAPDLTTPTQHILPIPATLTDHSTSALSTSEDHAASDLTITIGQTRSEITTEGGHNTSELTTLVSHTTSELTTLLRHTTSKLTKPVVHVTSKLITPKVHTTSKRITPVGHTTSELPTPVGHTTSQLTTPAGHDPSNRATPVHHITSIFTTPAGYTTSKLTTPTGHTTKKLTTLLGHTTTKLTTPTYHTTTKLITPLVPTSSKLTTTLGHTILELTEVGYDISNITTPVSHTTPKPTTPVSHTTSSLTTPAGHTTSKQTTQVDYTTLELSTLVGNATSDVPTTGGHRTLSLTTEVGHTTSNLTLQIGDTTSKLITPVGSITLELTTSAGPILSEFNKTVLYSPSSLSYDSVTKKLHMSTEKPTSFLTPEIVHNEATQWTVPYLTFHTGEIHTMSSKATDMPEAPNSWNTTSPGITGGTQTPEAYSSWWPPSAGPSGEKEDSSTSHVGSPKNPDESISWQDSSTDHTGSPTNPEESVSGQDSSTSHIGSPKNPEEPSSSQESSTGPPQDTKVPDKPRSRHPSSTVPAGDIEVPWQASTVPTELPPGLTLKVPEIFISRAHNSTSVTGRALKPLLEATSTLPMPSGRLSGVTSFEDTRNRMSMKTTVIHQKFWATSPQAEHPTHRTNVSTSHHATSRGVPERSGRIFIVEDQPPILKAREVNVSFQLGLEMDFSPRLESVDSLQRQALVLAFQETVSPFYKSVAGFMRLEVLSVRPVESRRPIHRRNGSVILKYAAIFNMESVNPRVMEHPDRLLNVSLLPDAVTSGLWVAGHRVLGVSATERWADLCSLAYSCLAGFACAHTRSGNITCTSLCHDGFCKNDGICTHRRGQEPICQCPVGSDYWYMGERCDYRMTQQALLGISCGVILSLLLCISAIAYLAMRRFKALLMETKINQTKSSYRRFSRFDDISTRYWSNSQSQSWLGASISSLDNLAFSHSEEVLHLHALESRRGSSQEDADNAGTCSPRSTPHRRPECRPGFHSDWETSCSSFNDPMVDSGKASAISVSSWPMEPIQWTPFPILHQLTAHSPFRTRRPHSYCEGMELVNMERSWTA